MYIKRKLFNVIFVLFLSFFLEFIIFNFSYIYSLLDKNTVYNSSYSESDISFINWDSQNNIHVSQTDPMLIIENIDTMVKNVQILFISNQPVSDITIFFTDNQNEFFGSDAMFVTSGPIEKQANILVNQYIKAIRIDLGEDPGLILSDVQITINPAYLSISISRIIAMIIIYIAARWLFSLQKIPNYIFEEGTNPQI